MLLSGTGCAVMSTTTSTSKPVETAAPRGTLDPTDAAPSSAIPSPTPASGSSSSGSGVSSPAPGTPSASGVDPESGLRWVSSADLPPEAAQTLRLVDSGGPYPYDSDGVTFENREQILPDRPLGYYREFTVDTPGSDDRGARRIVVGAAGEEYYTDDHYDSFSRIAR